ncbi:MAG TPA: phosphoenolpyruvate--protein phosphotransferase, partial [Gammaproteobacteria bacterium]
AEAMGGVNELLKEVSGSSFTLKGISGSTGLAIGQAVVVYVHANLDVIPDQTVQGEEIEQQIQLFTDAVNDVARDIEDLSSRFKTSLPPAELALFDAYGLMLKSDTLLDGVQARIREGSWAQGALRDTIADHVRIFDSMDDLYLRERASDIRDLGRRILERLQSKNNQVYKTSGPTVLVGEEIAVSHLAEIPPEHLVAVVSSKGSGASHVAILSHALGIPAVMGVGDLPVSRIKGQTMVVDGYRGQIFVKPTDAMLEEFRRLVREEQELSADLNELIDQPSQTTDGVHMPLLVNTGLLADISPSLRSGAEGVGLYRTEVPFLIRDGFPGEDEQAGIYRQVLEGFSPKPVTLRTLDIGGDKMLPYFPQREENPFLGWRGIRIMLDHPEIFLTQIRAVLRASERFSNLRLMLPMISDVSEVDEALSLIRRAHDELREDGIFSQLPPVGVMIEVPSAVYQMDALAKRVEFFSVGTNDLTQYLLAVDRNNTQVASLYDSLHPSVLRALQHVVNVAHEYGKPVSVCGEMAGNPAAAIILLGLGVDSLSMSAGSLLSIKWVMRSFSQQAAKDLTHIALNMEKASSIKTLLHKSLEDAGLGGLIRAGK